MRARLVRDSAAEVLPLSQLGGIAFGVRAAILQGMPAPLAAGSMIADVTTEMLAQIAYTASGMVILAARVPQSSHVAALIRAAALSYYPDRSGDLTIVPKENWILAGAGTTHGTSYEYDQHVPVILYGAGIRSGINHEAVTPADIAPTFASMLDVRLPEPDGHVLNTALAR